MRLNAEQIQELIEATQGTCQSLDVHCEALFGVELFGEVDNEMEVCNRIDEAIFECSCCGWWCEVGDWVDQGDQYNGEEICTQCGPENGFGDDD